MSTRTKTGQKAPVSGQYKPVGHKSEITLIKGKRVPPFQCESANFILVDRTKHKGGK